MIDAISLETAHLLGDALPSAHRLRHRIFIGRQKYAVPSHRGMEWDQFDTPAAVYMLWAYQRVFHGEVDDDNRTFPEIRPREAGVLGVLIGLIVFLGVYPKPLLERVEPSVDRLVEHVEARTGESIPRPEPELVEGEVDE